MHMCMRYSLCSTGLRCDRHLCLPGRRNRQKCSSNRGCYAELRTLVREQSVPNICNLIVAFEP